MMRRRTSLWIGLGVLFMTLFINGHALSKETYSVQPGDTLYGISSKHGVTLHALKASNRLNGTQLRPHQLLTIPSDRKDHTLKSNPSPIPPKNVFKVKKGDTLNGIAHKTGVPVSEIRELNHLRGNALKIGQELLLKKNNAKKAANKQDLKEEDDSLLSEEEALAEIEKQKEESSELLGQWSNPEEPKLLVKVAKGFLGAPYRLGGSSVTGIDCSGFVRKIYQFFNIDLPRTAFEQSRVGMSVARQELTEGDLIFFNTRKRVGHVGIYIGNNEFVHACSKKKGVRVDNLNTPYYDRRFIRAVRLKGNDGDL